MCAAPDSRVARYRNGGICEFRDYSVFHDCCAKSLEAERRTDDFVAAVEEFRQYLQRVGGPMADGSITSPSFAERRLLDKVMWMEGQWLKAANAERQ